MNSHRIEADLLKMSKCGPDKSSKQESKRFFFTRKVEL